MDNDRKIKWLKLTTIALVLAALVTFFYEKWRSDQSAMTDSKARCSAVFRLVLTEMRRLELGESDTNSMNDVLHALKHNWGDQEFLTRRGYRVSINASRRVWLDVKNTGDTESIVLVFVQWTSEDNARPFVGFTSRGFKEMSRSDLPLAISVGSREVR